MSLIDKLRAEETVSASALGQWPGEEFLHPFPLVAMAILGLNDHLLKGANGVPSLLTGKLSDFAGLIFFPLFLTAFLSTFMYLGFRLFRWVEWDYSLNRRKLVGAIAVTAGLFVPLQLWSFWAELYVDGLKIVDFWGIFHGFAVTPDPWDLTALFVLPLVYWFGRGKVALVPLGRLAVLRRRMERRAGGQREAMREVFRRGMRDVWALCPEAKKKALERLEERFCDFVAHLEDEEAFEAAQQALDRFREDL